MCQQIQLVPQPQDTIPMRAQNSPTAQLGRFTLQMEQKFVPPKWGRFPGETSPPRQSEKWWVLHSTPNRACTGGLSGGGRSCSGRENKTLYLKHKISRCFSNQGKEKAECLVGWGRAVVEWIPEPKGSSVWTPSSLQLGVRGAPCGCFCSLQLSNILI